MGADSDGPILWAWVLAPQMHVELGPEGFFLKGSDILGGQSRTKPIGINAVMKLIVN